MLTKNLTKFFLLAILLLCTVTVDFAQQTNPTRPPDPAAAQQPAAPSFKAPENIDFRTAKIMSEGVRLNAEIFSLKSLAGKQLPTIIMARKLSACS